MPKTRRTELTADRRRRQQAGGRNNRNRGGSGSGGSRTASTTSAPDGGGDDGFRMNAKHLLEKERQLGSADVDLAYVSNRNNGLAEEDAGSGSGGSSSSSSSEGSEGGEGHNSNAKDAASSNSATQPNNASAGNERRHARANKDKAYFTSPGKPPARRFRRKPDEMYEEWETSPGKYSVTYSCPQGSEANQSLSLKLRVLALSSHSIVESAHLLFPGGPRVFAFGEHAGTLMGVLFIPPNRGVVQDCTRDCHLMFYVIAGKLAVRMRLDGCGGKTARFSVNKGGAWEVPCGSTYAIANGLAMAAQVVFCRSRRVEAAASGEGMEPDRTMQA